MKRLRRKLAHWKYRREDNRLYNEWQEELTSVCSKIYYARVAMNSGRVGEHLNKLDALMRYGHRPEEYRGL